MQIMVLRQQLGEDGMTVLAMEGGEGTAADAESLFKEAVAKLQTSTADLPAAEVTDGHVDGYA